MRIGRDELSMVNDVVVVGVVAIVAGITSHLARYSTTFTRVSYPSCTIHA